MSDEAGDRFFIFRHFDYRGPGEKHQWVRTGVLDTLSVPPSCVLPCHVTLVARSRVEIHMHIRGRVGLWAPTRPHCICSSIGASLVSLGTAESCTDISGPAPGYVLPLAFPHHASVLSLVTLSIKKGSQKRSLVIRNSKGLSEQTPFFGNSSKKCNAGRGGAQD